jgi:hypothetical protein
MAQTPVQHYLPRLLERIEKGDIDPSFVVTHEAPLEQGPELHWRARRLTSGRRESGGLTARERCCDGQDPVLPWRRPRTFGRKNPLHIYAQWTLRSFKGRGSSSSPILTQPSTAIGRTYHASTLAAN